MDPSGAPSELDELRVALARLEHEQAWVRTTLETMPAIMMRVSLEGTIEFINRVLPEYAESAPVGQSIYAFAPADQHEVMRSALAHTTRTLQPSSYESVAEAPDGTRDWYITVVGPVIDAGGQLVGLTLVSSNASRLRRAEQALVESQASLRLALDAGNVGVWRWDARSDVVEWDEKLDAMFGLAPGTSPRNVAQYMELIPANQKDAMAAHVGRALATGLYPDFELGIERADGPRWFIIKGGVLRGPSGEVVGLLGGVVDVTERRRIDERLRQAQSLEALGQLSAGVAHNFNNMLAVILPALDLAKASAPPAHVTLLNDAFTSAMNAAQLVRQLAIFSRSGRPAPARYEPLVEVIRRTVELCRRTFARAVTLELGDVSAAREADVDSGPMEQAVMNLLLNARDALSDEQVRPSRIDVSARLLDEFDVQRRRAEARGRYVELRVADTGSGMDATTYRRMLEPFFTTKPTGRGTGLGLSTVWATVQAHRGFLECDTELGRGTVFSLLLPAWKAPVQTADPMPPPARGASDPRVVLIIDDEPAVRRATATLLADAGFVVLTAASGDEGLRASAEGSPDVVLLDYSMPGLSPQATLAGLRRERPSLPVVCLSGLVTPLEGATLQLIKPVTRDELLAALERALTSS